VTVIFPERRGENIAGAVRVASCHFPVPVIFSGEEMPFSDFLDTADHIEEWNGIRIGVFGSDQVRHNVDNANFHGVTLKINLPELHQAWHRTLFVRIAVVDCAHLKLVLHTRKEIVRDEMYDALIEEINRLYFRIVSESGAHSLTFQDYQRGRMLGIDLKEAAAFLRPHAAAFADADRNLYLSPQKVPSAAFVYEGAGSHAV